MLGGLPSHSPGPGREVGDFGGGTVHTGNKLLQGKGTVFRTCPELDQGLKAGATDGNMSAGGTSEGHLITPGFTDLGAGGRRDLQAQTANRTICLLGFRRFLLMLTHDGNQSLALGSLYLCAL